MKTISTILAAILCSASPLLAQDINGSTQSEQTVPTNGLKMGKESISMLRSAYQAGEYSSFLKEMDEAYQKALVENQLSGLSDMRVSGFPEMKDSQKWEETAAKLEKEKNQELLSLISDEDDSLVAQKIRSSTASISSEEQQKAIAQLSLYHFMTPGSGKTGDENLLIDIDMEYEFKVLNLAKPMGTDSASEIRNKQYVLRMEKMEKTLEASKNFQNSSLKQAVGLSAANFDERLAQNWDRMDLNALAKGKIKPSNPQEEKTAEILASHQGKFNDLFKEYLDSQPK